MSILVGVNKPEELREKLKRLKILYNDNSSKYRIRFVKDTNCFLKKDFAFENVKEHLIRIHYNDPNVKRIYGVKTIKKLLQCYENYEQTKPRKIKKQQDSISRNVSRKFKHLNNNQSKSTTESLPLSNQVNYLNNLNQLNNNNPIQRSISNLNHLKNKKLNK